MRCFDHWGAFLFPPTLFFPLLLLKSALSLCLLQKDMIPPLHKPHEFDEFLFFYYPSLFLFFFLHCFFFVVVQAEFGSDCVVVVRVMYTTYKNKGFGDGCRSSADGCFAVFRVLIEMEWKE
ncbi:hypothetical protein F4805DRAFT_234292 [Annulohypoxylon moriforme]|nr:hypothetical protein F4805DRAFT_234292 [Annulohypoxylon moriforme]